jgi:hypothetical protein
MSIIFYDPVTKLHNLFILSLIYELNNNNHHYEIINKIEINYENYDLEHDIIIIFLNPQFLKTHKNIYGEFIKISNNFRHKIYYITEPLNYLIDIKVWEEYIKILKPFKLLTYTNENLNKLKVYQSITKLCPKFNNYIDMGDYSIETMKNKNKDKIIFMGTMNIHRENVFKNMENKIVVKNDIWNMDEYQEIIENNLFFINIHRRNGCKCLEYLRIIPLLANGCIVISELSNEEDMNELKDYNIYFCDKANILDTYYNILKNINYNEVYYNEVYNKVNKFREEFIYDDIYNKIIQKNI